LWVALVLVMTALGRGAMRGAELSPFVPNVMPAADAPSAPDPVAGLEFAGLARFGPQVQVYLYYARARRGQWLELGVVTEGLLAEEYDADRQAVHVRAGAHARWLTMRNAAITAVPMVLRADRSIDWDHMKLTDRQKELKAAGQMWEMMEATRQMRQPETATVGASP
jgi:hypothetical protein